ncbi:MAG TPA: hypothetical protein VF763_00805 [Candidatus Limnocylindrales bacterium]
MRARWFQLRLLAAALTVLWAAGGGLVLLAYRPGGPIDLLVGLAAALPLPIAAAGLVWPPFARSDRAFAGIVWLGIGASLLLVPSIGGVLNQILARGPQTLLPSLEAVYPWLLALLATGLFSGLGIARRILGEDALRRRRLAVGVFLATLATVGVASAFAAVAVANELALRDRPVPTSRFGSTDPAVQPPACNGRLEAGSTARVALDLSGMVDGRSIGGALLQGERSGDDVRWTAEVATDRLLGRQGLVRLGATAWQLGADGSWLATTIEGTDGLLLDRSAVRLALAPGDRTAAEDRGLEFVEGARARHCRVAVDGATFVAAFPETRWLAGNQSLGPWRGELDYWVFEDGQVGQLDGSVNGAAGSIMPGALLATVRVHLTATDRGRPVTVAPPGP